MKLTAWVLLPLFIFTGLSCKWNPFAQKKTWVAKVTINRQEKVIYLEDFDALIELRKRQAKEAGVAIDALDVENDEKRIQMLNQLIDIELVYRKAKKTFKEKKKDNEKDLKVFNEQIKELRAKLDSAEKNIQVKSYREKYNLLMNTPLKDKSHKALKKETNELAVLPEVKNYLALRARLDTAYEQKRKRESDVDMLMEIGRRRLIAQEYLKSKLKLEDITVSEPEIETAAAQAKALLSRVQPDKRRKYLIRRLKAQKAKTEMEKILADLRQTAKITKNLELLNASMDIQDGDEKKVFLTIDDHKIYLRQFKIELEYSVLQLQMAAQHMNQPLHIDRDNAEIKNRVVDSIIGNYLAYQEALKAGLHKKEDVRLAVDLAVKEALVQQYFKEKYKPDEYKVPQEDIKKAYNYMVGLPQYQNIRSQPISKITPVLVRLLRRQYLQMAMMTEIKNLRDEALIKKDLDALNKTGEKAKKTNKK